MKIKHYLMALMCLTGMSLVTAACGDDDPIDNPMEDPDTPDDSTVDPKDDPTDDPSGGELAPYLKIFNEMKPGIYTCMDGDQQGVFAKGTDGSGFYISDITDYNTFYPSMHITENALPNNFNGFDGDRTSYSFVYSQPMLHEGYTCEWAGLTWSDEMIYKLEAVYPSRSEMMNQGEWLPIVIGYMSGTATKIDDAGDFQTTYMKLANRYQRFSHKIGPDKMMPQTTVLKPSGWLYDLYPNEMNTKKHIIPYTGGGDYMWMKVNRWMPTGPNVPQWYPCYVDFVEYVEAQLENVSEADARAYIQKVKDEAPVNNIVKDDKFDTANEDGTPYSIIHFEMNGERDEGELGHNYFYPGYEVIYMKEEGKSLLTIKFTTNYLLVR